MVCCTAHKTRVSSWLDPRPQKGQVPGVEEGKILPKLGGPKHHTFFGKTQIWVSLDAKKSANCVHPQYCMILTKHHHSYGIGFLANPQRHSQNPERSSAGACETALPAPQAEANPVCWFKGKPKRFCHTRFPNFETKISPHPLCRFLKIGSCGLRFWWDSD